MLFIVCFFFNDTATTEIYPYLHTLSLHGALPIYPGVARQPVVDDLFLVFHDHSLLQGDSFRPGTALPQVRAPLTGCSAPAFGVASPGRDPGKTVPCVSDSSSTRPATCRVIGRASCRERVCQ